VAKGETTFVEASEPAKLPTRGSVPQADVEGARGGQVLPVGRERRPGRIVELIVFQARLKAMKSPPRHCVPDLDGPVPASCGDPFCVGRERHRGDLPAMAESVRAETGDRPLRQRFAVAVGTRSGRLLLLPLLRFQSGGFAVDRRTDCEDETDGDEQGPSRVHGHSLPG